MAVFDLKNATVKIKDGTGTPKSFSVRLAEGQLTFKESKAFDYLMNRGKLDKVIQGDDVPLEASLTGRWEFIKGDSADTFVGALKGTNTSWVSTDADTCAPYACDIEIEFTPTCSTEKIETILLPDFRAESFDYNASDRSISTSGRCNVTEATITRTAQV